MLKFYYREKVATLFFDTQLLAIDISKVTGPNIEIMEGLTIYDFFLRMDVTYLQYLKHKATLEELKSECQFLISIKKVLQCHAKNSSL